MLTPRPLMIPTATTIQKPYSLFDQSYEVNIMPIVINSLRGIHTNTNTDICGLKIAYSPEHILLSILSTEILSTVNTKQVPLDKLKDCK